MTAPLPEVRSRAAKYVHVSPRKARLVVDHIRGRTVPEARTILAFMPRAAAREIEKVLRSAVANAESNPNLHWDGDDLVIAAALRRRGPDAQALARSRARPRQLRSSSAPATSRSRSTQPDGRCVSGRVGAALLRRRSAHVASGRAAAAARQDVPQEEEAVAA